MKKRIKIYPIEPCDYRVVRDDEGINTPGPKRTDQKVGQKEEAEFAKLNLSPAATLLGFFMFAFLKAGIEFVATKISQARENSRIEKEVNSWKSYL